MPLPWHHAPSCAFRAALACRFRIACPHGLDACPDCDPCTCRPAAAGSERLLAASIEGGRG